ncbi:PBECR2 nuclease fold domain-containing protein [Campylobacter devanensis]|uniref:putative barnase/colicin E5 family endoribonuclease n=1 Tax=Campylobacter devanensis TaxID=3161138 RepID=UPI000A34B818|nr:PBECR2 nuclease fold domain-containing protein [Campylobacter sp. P0107]
MENLYENFKKYAKKAYKQVEPLVPFSNANQYAFNPRSELYNNSQALDIQNDTDILNQQMANYRANQNGTFMLNALTKSDEQRGKDSIDFDNKFIDLAYSKGYTPHKAIDKDGKARYAIEKDGVFKEIEPSFLNDFKANSYEMLGSLAGVVSALPHPYAKTAGVVGKVLTPMVGSAVGSGAGAMADTYLNNKSVGENTTSEQLANSFIGGANNDILGAGLATAITSKPAINIAKGTLKAPLEVLDKGLTGVGARHILSQNIGGAGAALKANLGGDHEFRNALDSAKDALGADLDNFVRTDLKTIDKTSDNRYIQKGIDIANSAINRANETLKGLNVGKADAELLLSALGHENGVKNILDSVANNPKSAQKIAEISSNLNKSFAGSINEQLAKFETQTPKDSFKNSFNQVKKDYADTKDFLVKNSNYQSDFKDLNDNLATILSDTQNINTRGVFNALNGGGNLENLLNAKNAINEQLGYIIKADFKSSSDFINQKALSEAKSLIDNEINTALKNDENLINLYKSANGDYATMKNIVDSNLMNQISRDGKTSLEALNAMIKSNENINGVTLNEFLSSLGAKDRAIAEANIIKGLMEKNSVNGVVDFRALNQSLNSLDFGSEFAKELKSQILNRQALLNNTSDILNALGSKVVKSKNMSQGISTDPLKRAETMKANFVVEKLKPLIPRLGNNEALKLHLNKAILNANGDFKLAIKNIDNIPDGNLPTPTRNLLNEFKNAVKEIEKQVVKADNQPNLANQANSGNIDSLTQATPNLAQNSIKGDGFVTYPNSARQETAINQNFNIQEWVKNMSGVISDEWRANLTKLAKKHPEMFRSEADVFRVIKEIKDNPTHFFKNYDDDVALIGKKLNNNKDGNIGIVKNSGEIIHANKNRSGDLDRLQRKQLKNYEKDGAIAGTPAPATTRPNNGVEGEIIKNRTNAKTIPNQSIKEAENQANLVKKENERLLKRNSYPVGSPTPTQLTFGKTAEPTANGAKALLGKKEKAVSGDALPPHLDADNTSLTGRYSVGGKPHLTASDKNIIPQNAKNEVKEQAVKAKTEPTQDAPNLARDGAVSETDARNLVKNISSNKDIAIQLQPKADLLKLVKDFSNVIKTPIFESKISIDKLLNHLADKTDADKRLEYLNLIKPTLENPLFITRENNRYRFVKTFIDSDKITKFLSVIENDKGEFIGITATPIKNTDLKNLLKGDIIWGGDTLSTLSTPQIAKQEVEAMSKTIPNQTIKEAETAKDLTADAPSELYKAHRKAQKAKETAKPQEPTAAEKPRILDIEKEISNEIAADEIKKGNGEFVAGHLNIYNKKQQKEILDYFKKTDEKLYKRALYAKEYGVIDANIRYDMKKLYSIRTNVIQDQDITDKTLLSKLKDKTRLSKWRQSVEQELNIKPIKEFGTNYTEFYHDGANAIKKLLVEKQGQVAGAFYKEGLGDIDVVWGNKEIGLNKIIEKHSKDFESFGGVEKGLAEIIEKGKNINENGVDTIWYKKGDDYYAVGLSKGFKNQGDNNWVITAYEKKNLNDSQKLKIDKLFNGGDSKTISAYAEIKSSKTPELTTAENSTPKTTKSQAQVEQQAKQYAKWLSQADKIPPQAPDELYKAYDKAKKDLKPKK